MSGERAALEPFTFDGTDRRGAEVVLRYRVGHERFEERYRYPAALPEGPAVDRAVRLLHLLAGVSYYKAFAPRPLHVPVLTDDERALVTSMYDAGLREMAYVNHLPLPLPVELNEDPDLGGPPADHPPAELDGALIPVGGGKDSALVGALLPDAALMSVNPKGAHERLAAALGRPLLGVERTLDPALRRLAEEGRPNGHVPVTAIVSAAAVLLALATGRRDVVMGLERSASEPTLVHDGVAVNHQHSKSAEAEGLLRAAVAPLGVRYFSLLRPLTELGIAAAVVRRGLTANVLSCNEAFTIWRESASSRTQAACGVCPKCLFAALILAPFLDPSELRAMYDRDVLDNAEARAGMAALWSADKPFECVGERVESAAAMVLLSGDARWRDHALVRALGGEARAVLEEEGVEPGAYLVVGDLSTVPTEHRPILEQVAAELVEARGSLSDAPR